MIFKPEIDELLGDLIDDLLAFLLKCLPVKIYFITQLGYLLDYPEA